MSVKHGIGNVTLSLPHKEGETVDISLFNHDENPDVEYSLRNCIHLIIRKSTLNMERVSLENDLESLTVIDSTVHFREKMINAKHVCLVNSQGDFATNIEGVETVRGTDPLVFPRSATTYQVVKVADDSQHQSKYQRDASPIFPVLTPACITIDYLEGLLANEGFERMELINVKLKDVDDALAFLELVDHYPTLSARCLYWNSCDALPEAIKSLVAGGIKDEVASQIPKFQFDVCFMHIKPIYAGVSSPRFFENNDSDLLVEPMRLLQMDIFIRNTRTRESFLNLRGKMQRGARLTITNSIVHMSDINFYGYGELRMENCLINVSSTNCRGRRLVIKNCTVMLGEDADSPKDDPDNRELRTAMTHFRSWMFFDIIEVDRIEFVPYMAKVVRSTNGSFTVDEALTMFGIYHLEYVPVTPLNSQDVEKLARAKGDFPAVDWERMLAPVGTEYFRSSLPAVLESTEGSEMRRGYDGYALTEDDMQGLVERRTIQHDMNSLEAAFAKAVSEKKARQHCTIGWRIYNLDTKQLHLLARLKCMTTFVDSIDRLEIHDSIVDLDAPFIPREINQLVLRNCKLYGLFKRKITVRSKLELYKVDLEQPVLGADPLQGGYFQCENELTADTPRCLVQSGAKRFVNTTKRHTVNELKAMHDEYPKLSYVNMITSSREEENELFGMIRDSKGGLSPEMLIYCDTISVEVKSQIKELLFLEHDAKTPIGKGNIA